MEIIKWSPFRASPLRGFDLWDAPMRRLFEDAGLAPAVLPAADVYETDDEFVVELEVPGYEEKELEVEVTDHTLRVTGERAEEKEKKDKAFHLHERLEKSFERRFQLPTETKTDAVKADFRKGVLEIHAPKVQPVTPRTIAIGKKP